MPQGSDSFSEALDMSLDRDIYINNAKMVREAAFEYLKNCLKEYSRDEKSFH
jgi:16S rRNA C1402 N4-methylase RsmH